MNNNISNSNNQNHNRRRSITYNPLFNSKELREEYKEHYNNNNNNNNNNNLLPSFPLLPRTIIKPRTEDPIYRYHQLRSGYHLTSVLNDPSYILNLNEELPFIVPPYPGLSDYEIGIDSLRSYVAMMSPITNSFNQRKQQEKYQENQPIASFAPTSISRERIQQAERDAEISLTQCLRIVPEMYFRNDYRVHDPQIFTEMAAKSDSMLQQEKLSHYLDLVEVNLLKQISARSHSFFTALVTMQQLHHQIVRGTRQIGRIRRRISILKQRLIDGSLITVQSSARKSNMKCVVETLELVQAVLHSRDGIKELLSIGKYTEALDILENTQKSLDNQLAGLKCLQYANVKLHELRLLIEKLIVSELIRISVYNEESIMMSEEINNNNNEELNINEKLKLLSNINDIQCERIINLIHNLVRIQITNIYITTYREEMTQNITKYLKDLVIWQLNEIDINNEGNMAERLHQLTHTQFLQLLEILFENLNYINMRMICIMKLIENEEKLQDSPWIDDDEDARTLKNRFHDIICNLIEYIHSRCARLLNLRAEIHAELELSQLRSFFDISLRFVMKCEQNLGKTFYGLRGALLTQAKAFLEKFHIKSINKLALSLEKEQWQRVPVPRYYQILLDRGFQKKTQSLNIQPNSHGPKTNKSKQLLKTLKNGTSNWEDDENIENEEKLEEKKEKSSRVIFVPDINPKTGKKMGTFSRYPLVPSLLLLLDMIASYVECATQLQAVGSDVLHRLIEMLKLFNSRTCQLVLGAGAMHLAGLKSINAKHLALSSQCLGLVISQIPSIRNALQRHLPQKHNIMLNGLDRVEQDYYNHQKEILEKLVSIVKDLTESTGKRLLKLDWASSTEKITKKQIAKPAKCILTLMKQTSSLHRVLSELLPIKQRDQVFNNITEVFSSTLCKYLSRIGSTDSYVRSHVSCNVHHVLKSLRSLDGVPNNGCHDLEIFII